MTLKALARTVKIESRYGVTATPWDKQTDWQHNAHPYRVTLRYRGRRLTCDFWMGQALTDEPSADCVLDCLLSDSTVPDDFEEFCREFGYDVDSRMAERTHRECMRLGVKVRRLLGDDFDTFVQSDR